MFVCAECGSSESVPGQCSSDGMTRAPIGDDVLLGTTIGAYRIARLLGIGGMGRVYKGVHPTIGSRVAIKVLSRECSDRRDLVERFFSEAKAVNLIRHESIVNVLDLSVLPDGRPYIIMEYLDGSPLSAIIDHSTKHGMPLPLGGLARLAAEVLDALGAAHGKGIVHRDLKPDNIFVTPSGRPKVLDFGIAKLNDPAMSSATRTGSLLGTPHYMSPEQAAGKPVDHRADIYAIGVILFECATGQKPFIAESLFDLLRKHVEAPAPPPSQFRRDMSRELEQVILASLEKSPDRRFASTQAMSMALQSATASLPAEQWTPITGSGSHRAQPSGGWQPTPPVSWGGGSGGASRAHPRESVQPPMMGHVPTMQPMQQPMQQGMQQPMQQPMPPLHQSPIGHLSTVSASSGQVHVPQQIAKPPSKKGLWIGLGAVALIGGGIAAGVAATSGSDQPAASAAPREDVANRAATPNQLGIDLSHLDEAQKQMIENAIRASQIDVPGLPPDAKKRLEAFRDLQKLPPEDRAAKLLEMQQQFGDLNKLPKPPPTTPEAPEPPTQPQGAPTKAAPPPPTPGMPPGYTPPVPRSPASGPWLQSRDLGFPLDYKPERVDVAAFIRWSIAEAKRVVPDAELFRIDVDNVRPDGTADLTLPTLASDSGSIGLRFQSPSRMGKDPTIPKGVKQVAKCEFRIEAEDDGAEIRAVEGFSCDKNVAIRPPKCSPVALWKKALARRAPSDAVANLGYRFSSGTAKWYFDIGQPGEMIFSTVYNDDDC